MATVDTLQINIQTNSAEAAKGISSLSRAINTLSTKAEKIPAINQVFASLRNAINKVSDNSIARIERLSAACGDLAYSVSQLQKAGKIGRLVSEITKAAEKAGIPGLEKTPAAETSGVNAPDISQETKNVKDLGTESEKTEKSVRKLKVTIRSASKTAGLFASIKRIAFYRMIRSVIKSITQAFQEGVQNIVLWSKAIDNDNIINANKVMSAYSTEWLKIKNTIGAMVIPILNALLPTVKDITSALIDAGNALAEIFTLLNNPEATEFVGINKDIWKDYADSIGKANKQLQKFDEINNLTTNGNGGVDANDMFKVYETTRKIELKWSDILEDIKTIGTIMAGLWVTSEIATWGNAVAALFAEGGSAAVLSSLAGWIAAGGVALTLTIEYLLKKKTGKGMGDWANDILSGNTDFQKKFNEWWDKTFTEKWQIEGSEDDIYRFAADITGELAKALGESAYKLLTPMGWWETFIKKPIAAINELKDNFNLFDAGLTGANTLLHPYGWINPLTEGIKGAKETVGKDVIAIKDQWSWLDKTLQSTVPKADLNDDDLWNFQSAVKDAKEKWTGLKNLDVLSPEVRAEKVTAFRDAIKNVLETWKILGQKDDLELGAVLKLTAALGLEVDGKDGMPSWIGDYETVIEKLAKLIEELKTELTNALTSGNPLQGLTTFTSTLLTKLKTFLNDLSEVGGNIVGAISQVGGGSDGGYSDSAVKQTIRKTKYINQYASGGYPTQGQLFLANEAGAEMVGSIGGRTAVANNQQITEAIATACYNAMSQALSENGMNVTLQGDANGLFRVVQKQARMYRQTTGTAAF